MAHAVRRARALIRLATILVAALVLLQLIWELWLAPLRPGGSWLALKAVPLALLWPALARGSRYARQLTLLLLLFYFTEGVVRAFSERGGHALLAASAALLAMSTFCTLFIAYRTERALGKGDGQQGSR